MSKIKLTEEQIEMATKLTSLQRKVVINVVSGMSQRQAYVKAGGGSKTEKAQDASVARMLADVKVKKFYNSLLNTAAENAVFTKEMAIKRLTDMVEVDVKDFYDIQKVVSSYDEEGEPVYSTVWTIKHPDDMSEKARKAIKGYKMTRNGPELEIQDPQGAIKQLSNMQGWDAPKKQEITGANGKPLAVKSNIEAPEIANALHGLMGKL